MGYRTRRRAEYIVVFQKRPIRAKAVWTRHNIPDVWQERITAKKHAHAKPAALQAALIEAVTEPDDVVVDPCAGSFSVLQAAREIGRNFVGCDLLG